MFDKLYVHSPQYFHLAVDMLSECIGGAMTACETKLLL